MGNSQTTPNFRLMRKGLVEAIVARHGVTARWRIANLAFTMLLA